MSGANTTRDVSGVRLPTNIYWSLTETDECPHCHRLTPRPYVMLMGSSKRFMRYPCDCTGAKAERKRFEEEQARFLGPEVNVPERYAPVVEGIDVREWVESVKEGYGIYFHGKNGTGKTTLAYAIGSTLGKQGWIVENTTAFSLSSELYDSYSSQVTQDEIFGKLESCSLLVIDDLGKEAPTESNVAVIYRVINARYDLKRPVVITSNYSLGELGKRFSSANPSTASAIVSRLREMVLTVEVGGNDRRLA